MKVLLPVTHLPRVRNVACSADEVFSGSCRFEERICACFGGARYVLVVRGTPLDEALCVAVIMVRAGGSVVAGEWTCVLVLKIGAPRFNRGKILSWKDCIVRSFYAFSTITLYNVMRTTFCNHANLRSSGRYGGARSSSSRPGLLEAIAMMCTIFLAACVSCLVVFCMCAC